MAEDKIQIFFRNSFIAEEKIVLSVDEIGHLKSLRLNDLEKQIEIRDGKGNSFYYSIGSRSKTGNLIRKEIHPIPNQKLEVASAIPKSSRLELWLQKGTEIGVTKFHFINFFQSDRKEFNSERGEKIITEALSQSKRHRMPEIQMHNSLSSYLVQNPNSFFLNPKADKKPDSQTLMENIPIIGPEGGFREEEIELLNGLDIRGFYLGEGILKIETACIYMASLKSFSAI